MIIIVFILLHLGKKFIDNFITLNMNFTASFSAVGLIKFIMKKRVCIFICFFFFVGDRGVKTKENINYLQRMVSFILE